MKSEILSKLEQGTAHKKSRVAVANFVIRKELLADLNEIAFDTNHPLHIKAYWVLELVCEAKLKTFVPFLDVFCNQLKDVRDDSAIRPSTKICMFLAKSNHRKNGINLTQEQEHSIIENCLDRLIQDEKVGAKYYSIKALFILGKKYEWINEELKVILDQGYAEHSPAYKAAARSVLKKLNK